MSVGWIARIPYAEGKRADGAAAIAAALPSLLEDDAAFGGVGE